MITGWAGKQRHIWLFMALGVISISQQHMGEKHSVAFSHYLFIPWRLG
jgi:hypothetical protein